ncbi:MAG TPA: tetratricopeptide repeat protein [Longimicrobiales bacterium]|nr:tetratricopeptide repeat protein [Longimicrobiales bacterium]
MKRGGFLSELKRRRVWRVAGAYVIVGWMAVEIVLGTFPLLGVPEWVLRLVVILAFLGFPLTLVLAWAYDLTPQGVVLTPPLETEGTAPAAPTVVIRTAPGRLAGVFGAGILVALVGFGAYSAYVPNGPLHPEAIQALAVLPFADLSAAGDQRYFADGVTEELINRLSGVREIRVAARTSSFAFRDEEAELPEIARRLRVDAVVDGSVRREGDQLRVTVELVDARSGFQIWAEKYDRTVDDIFAIQDDISAAIVAALRLQLIPGVSRLRAGTESVRAHDAYLLGLARWHDRTEEDLLRALAYFEEAVAEDPAFAPAHAGIALTYAVLPTYAPIPAAVAAERGSGAAARALALDAHLAEAHAAIGQIAQALEWNLDAAEMAYRRAIEFQPNYATAHQWYAETLLMRGRLAESRREIEAALGLDPLSFAGRFGRAYLLTVERRDQEAREAYRALVRENPTHALAQMGLAFHCLAFGCPRDAEVAFRAAVAPALAGPLIEAARATAEPARRDGAARALRTLDGRLPPAQLALMWAAVGMPAEALDRLEAAFREGEDPNLPFYLVHPLFDPVRRDPRFRSIAAAIGAEAPMAAVTRPAAGPAARQG